MHVLQEGKNNTNNVHPVIAATNSVARTWDDRNNLGINGDFIVQGDPLNPLANGELGPSPNNNFGRPNTTLAFDPDWATGFNARPYNWETLVTFQHELFPRVGVEVSYNRRSYGNFIVNDNLLTAPTDYDPFCVTAQVDPRFPSGSPSQICGLYDLNPSRVGQVSTLRTYSGKYGKQIETWNGLDLNAQVRLPGGAFLQGGAALGKQVMDNCDVVTKLDNPSTYQCRRESGLLPQVKLMGNYPLPWWGLQISGTLQSSIPDPVGGANFDYNYFGLGANVVYNNAAIAPSLGRTLSTAPAATSRSTCSIPVPSIRAARTSSTCARPRPSASAACGCRGCWTCTTSSTTTTSCGRTTPTATTSPPAPARRRRGRGRRRSCPAA